MDEDKLSPELADLRDFIVLTASFSDLLPRSTLPKPDDVRPKSRTSKRRHPDASSLPVSEKLAERWRQVRGSPLYRRLWAIDGVKQAYATFETKVKRAKTGPLSDPFARLRFLGLIATVLELNRLSPIYGFKELKFPSKRTNRSALIHVSKLVACMDEGVGFQNLSEDNALREQLLKLQSELHIRIATQRKPREDSTHSARSAATQILDGFLKVFNSPLPSVVCDLASALGYPDGVENRTIEKLASERLRLFRKRPKAQEAAKGLRADATSEKGKKMQ